MMIDSNPTRRLITSSLCEFTFLVRTNMISSYDPSNLGSQIEKIIRLYIAFGGICHTGIKITVLRFKIYTTHFRYPQSSTHDMVCALLLHVDRIFFGLNLREKTKTGQRIFVNFEKFA